MNEHARSRSDGPLEPSRTLHRARVRLRMTRKDPSRSGGLRHVRRQVRLRLCTSSSRKRGPERREMRVAAQTKVSARVNTVGARKARRDPSRASTGGRVACCRPPARHLGSDAAGSGRRGVSFFRILYTVRHCNICRSSIICWKGVGVSLRTLSGAAQDAACERRERQHICVYIYIYVYIYI